MVKFAWFDDIEFGEETTTWPQKVPLAGLLIVKLVLTGLEPAELNTRVLLIGAPNPLPAQ